MQLKLILLYPILILIVDVVTIYELETSTIRNKRTEIVIYSL
jgi:hypothetical protein